MPLFHLKYVIHFEKITSFHIGSVTNKKHLTYMTTPMTYTNSIDQDDEQTGRKFQYIT